MLTIEQAIELIPGWRGFPLPPDCQIRRLGFGNPSREPASACLRFQPRN
ncbi:hypothetical protein QUF72_06225 [Desulfobacterales bacterium HSG2]|nr:hypothetical protein [Desulfobacterales bacterium HSG2]